MKFYLGEVVPPGYHGGGWSGPGQAFHPSLLRCPPAAGPGEARHQTPGLPPLARPAPGRWSSELPSRPLHRTRARNPSLLRSSGTGALLGKGPGRLCAPCAPCARRPPRTALQELSRDPPGREEERARQCAPPEAWGPGHICAEDLRALSAWPNRARISPKVRTGLRRRRTPSTLTRTWAPREHP